MPPRKSVTALTLLATVCIAPRAGAQGPPAGRGADSAVIARERGMWEALQKKDVAGFNKLAGGSPSIATVTDGGIGRASSDQLAKLISSNCETRSSALDSVTVEWLGESAVVLTYRATLDRTCGGRKLPAVMYAMSVWARRNGRWQAVAQSVTPARGNNE